MISGVVVAGLFSLSVTLAYAVFKRCTRPTLHKIRGPKSSSFVLGNLLELFQRPVGQADFDWSHLYGGVVRIKTVFGGDQLLVSDPKALQSIFGTSAYGYHKLHNLRMTARMTSGNGITWADGEIHRRQRKILLPGFGAPETKALLNVFQGCAESLCIKWTEIVGDSNDKKATINISASLSRATLDAIGEAAFDVQFGTVLNDDHQLAKKYNNMMSDIFGSPSAQQIFIQAASMYVPSCILEWLVDHGPNPRLKRAREIKEAGTEVARYLIQEKAEGLLAGKGRKDIFSLLVRANMDPEAKNKLTEEEMLAQMRTILFVGHETTAVTLSWILLELARYPEMQSKLRSEIRATEATIRARGETQFTISDFDAMPYTTAVIKEGLRYHPVVPHVQRVASTDNVIPLSQPITTENGQAVNEVVVPKGTRVVISIAAYNRNKDLWGADAHDFNPERWLDGSISEKTSIGVYSNLMTFLSGVRSCLGWRFSIIEIQAFLVEIIGKFDFAMTDQATRIRRDLSIVMVPKVEGEIERGTQLPLVVSVATREESD